MESQINMKTSNFKVGKKQIILACLTLMLGIAIYVNYALGVPVAEKLQPTDVLTGTGLNYGDATYVNSDTKEDTFAQARIDKMTARDEAIDTLKTVMNGGDATNEEKAVVAEKAEKLSQLQESETKVESLIKAAGFEDCVVYLDGESANIVVKTEGLLASQAAQIKQILLNEVSVDNEKIHILESK